MSETDKTEHATNKGTAPNVGGLARCRPGLAGGLDTDGGRATYLMDSGFAAVEFGTVEMSHELGDGSPLSGVVRRVGQARGRRARAVPALGLCLGSLADSSSPRLLQDWVAGMQEAAPVFDYVSINLSARARAPLLDPYCASRIGRALCALVSRRESAGFTNPRLALAIKIPLGVSTTPLPRVAKIAADEGVDGIVAVLPDGLGRFDRLTELCEWLAGRTRVVAVGGIRSADDVRAALRAGADGVQVHRLFSELGPVSLQRLLPGFGT